MLFWGLSCLFLSVVVSALALVGARDPAKPGWFENFQWIWGVLITGLAVFGVLLTCFGFGDLQAISTTEAVSSLLVAGLAVVGLLLIAPKKRLRQYAALKKTTI